MSLGIPVREFGGKIIGYLEQKDNGDIVVRAFSGMILGKYDSACDVTRDFYGRILFKGNQAGALLSINSEK